MRPEKGSDVRSSECNPHHHPLGQSHFFYILIFLFPFPTVVFSISDCNIFSGYHLESDDDFQAKADEAFHAS